MFTGIIEAQAIIEEIISGGNVLRIRLRKPNDFNDLKIGDSVSVNGVCLTIEEIIQDHLTFSVAKETLDVTGWNEQLLNNMTVNLERPLLANARIHGHWVTGHVDTVLKVVSQEVIGENKILNIELPARYQSFIIEKGSVTLNGVALTINEVNDKYFSVCLIPETLKKTNLSHDVMNMKLNIEFDYLVKIVNKSLGSFKANNKINLNNNSVQNLRGQNA